jgi:class 3 adenylate cyclase/tetratricopeptide (TPR) repeat protein
MHCPLCRTDNPADASFCEQCGAKLELVCPACKTALSTGARFCKKCGTAIAAKEATLAKKSNDAPIRVAEISSSENLDGERKTVTALFADIKGSMELIEDLDPEEARAIVDPALKLMMDAVHHYGGYVAQSTGDGIFALFGAPVAHEDHPQRALYAGLRLQEEMRRYSTKLRAAGKLPIEARVGVNTGEVVVRSIATGEGHVEYTPIGHSTSLAARMQALAPTSSVATTDATRRLGEGYFTFKSLGPTVVKGVSDPVEVYEVTGLGPLRTRLQRSAGRGLTKFVGREREMEALKHATEQAKSGHGQIVAAMAEPGVGKSRLFFEFKATSQSGWMVLETFSVSHGKASAYLPVIDLLRNYFKIASDDDERTRREKVTGRVLALDRSLEDTLPYLFALLVIVEGEDPLAQMDRQIRRRRTLEAIKRILLRESLNQPLMVIFEDLHWIDEATQELLNLMADSIGTAKFLLLVNYRPEYRHEWGHKTYYTQLRLDPLGKESADEMLSALLGDGKDLLPLKRLIIERTEGTPFFMEEMAQALFEDGVLQRNGTVRLVKSMNAVKVPATVQAILASRIDRLPPDEKELLQTLAVIGREFALSLVRWVVGGRKDDELERMLASLQTAEFIYEQPATGDMEYIFKHALTQEVAYNSVLVERRKLLHERAGQALESLYAAKLEERLGELSHHYTRSGNTDMALDFVRRFAQRLAEQGANSEAVAQVNAGLKLLHDQAPSAERARRELELQLILVAAHAAILGPAAAAVEETLEKAIASCEALGDSAQLCKLLGRSSGLFLFRGQVHKAKEVSERLLRLADSTRDPMNQLVAYTHIGEVMWWLGEWRAAREYFERALRLPAPARLGADFYMGDPRILAAGLLATTLLFLGYADQARSQIKHAIALAHDRPSPKAVIGSIAGWLYLVVREPQSVLDYAERNIALASQYGFHWELAFSTLQRGWARAHLGQPDQGVAELRAGLDQLDEIGVSTRVAHFTSQLLEGLLKARRIEEGLNLVSEAVAFAQATGAKFYEPDYHRLEGDLLLMKGAEQTALAEGCFRNAIEIAGQHGAKWFELRAAVSLARLLNRQSKRDEARTMLVEIYGWFTEGFDTADLKDAKALLDELSA